MCLYKKSWEKILKEIEKYTNNTLPLIPEIILLDLIPDWLDGEKYSGIMLTLLRADRINLAPKWRDKLLPSIESWHKSCWEDFIMRKIKLYNNFSVQKPNNMSFFKKLRTQLHSAW